MNIERTEKRIFYVYTQRGDGNGTAFGIYEVKDGYTKAIHSIYIEGDYSQKERTNYVCRYITQMLKPNEYASINYTGLNFSKIDVQVYGYRAIKHRPTPKYSLMQEQAHLLYDAMRRKTTITEVFDDNLFKYKPQRIFETTMTRK